MSWRGLGRNVDDGQVVVSEFNKLEGNRYYDVESQTSFEVDHITQVGFPYGHRVCLHADGWVEQEASAAQSYALDSQNSDLM